MLLLPLRSSPLIGLLHLFLTQEMLPICHQRHLTPSVTSRSDVPLFFHFFFLCCIFSSFFFFFFGVLLVAFLVTWPTEMTLSVKGEWEQRRRLTTTQDFLLLLISVLVVFSRACILPGECQVNTPRQNRQYLN